MTRCRVAAAILVLAAAGLLGTTGGTSNTDLARPYRPAPERPARPVSTTYLICAEGPRC
jgi:hypothetical protein